MHSGSYTCQVGPRPASGTWSVSVGSKKRRALLPKAELGRLCLRVAALFSATVNVALLRKTPSTLYCFPQNRGGKKREKIKKVLCPQPLKHKKEDFKDLGRGWRFSWIVDKTERFKIN